MPGMLGMPGMPVMPSMPGMPGKPGIPGMPGLRKRIGYIALGGGTGRGPWTYVDDLADPLEAM